MNASRRSAIKARGVLLATFGLATALGLMLGMRLLDLTSLSFPAWWAAVACTAFVQAALFLTATRGWDSRLSADPHFLYTPLTGALLLLALYMFLAPELRFIILLGWFVALLFMVGLGGFRSVVTLSGIMLIGYTTVAFFHYRNGFPLSAGFETAFAGGVFVISIYAGVVFERIRAERDEMRELRRRLSSMALTDPLTQLPNRRHFEQVLRAELDRLRRHGGTLTVAMVDVDYFKHYNDAVGHLTGDTALRELADVMRRELRLHDMVARFGGEEFALIIIDAGKEAALPIIERLRIDVQEHPFRKRDVQPEGRLTVSAGVATFPDDGFTYELLLKRADDALYRAKRQGRNRICLAEPPRVVAS